MAACATTGAPDEWSRELARGEAIRVAVPRAGRMRAGSADRRALPCARRLRGGTGGPLAGHGRRADILAVASGPDHGSAGAPLRSAPRALDARRDEGAWSVCL